MGWVNKFMQKRLERNVGRRIDKLVDSAFDQFFESLTEPSVPINPELVSALTNLGYKKTVAKDLAQQVAARCDGNLVEQIWVALEIAKGPTV